jgi:hypothetical protein
MWGMKQISAAHRPKTKNMLLISAYYNRQKTPGDCFASLAMTISYAKFKGYVVVLKRRLRLGMGFRRAGAAGVCGIGAMEGAGPTFSAMEGGYVGHGTNAGCSSP